MKFILSFLLIFIIGQPKDTVDGKVVIGTNITKPGEFRELVKDNSITGFNKDLAGEAVDAGFGTSQWDKNIQFAPGMNLEEARLEEKKEYLSNLFTIIGIISGTIILIGVAVYLSNKEKKNLG